MLRETKVTKMVAMIRGGSYIEEVAQKFELSVSYVYKLLKENYPVRRELYSNLLKTSRENKKKRAEETKALSEPMSENAAMSNQEEVVVLETGYMLAVGVKAIEDILKEGLDVYVPFFCVKELEKLSRSYHDAEALMTVHWQSGKITSLNLKGKESLYVEASYPIRQRSKGVVSVCIELASKGFRVNLYTNSKEIKRLAEMQECKEITVNLVEPRQAE